MFRTLMGDDVVARVCISLVPSSNSDERVHASLDVVRRMTEDGLKNQLVWHEKPYTKVSTDFAEAEFAESVAETLRGAEEVIGSLLAPRVIYKRDLTCHIADNEV